MKKTAYILFSALVLLFVGISIVRAQDFTFEKAYQDYNFTFDQYSQSFTDYEKAKDFYLKNPTLTLKEDARKKTLTMLRNRDEVERVYLTALRLKITEVKGLSKDEKEKILGKIDSEVAWYKSHKEVYQDSTVLEDLFGKSKESQSRYKTDTTPIIYEALYYVSLGEVTGSRNDHEAAYTEIRKELDGKVAEGKLKIDPFNRWLTDIDGVVNQLKANEVKSKEEIAKIYSQNYTDPQNSFKTGVAVFADSITLLTQLNSFLHELLTSYNSQLQAQQPQ
ncbi:MAG: hypothetical protein ACHQUA_00815 [Microgenomates group bacterium]